MVDETGLSGWRGIMLTIRFGCELGMLVALAYWGLWAGDGISAWLLGLGAPAGAAAIWGAFVAPKAKWPVSVARRVAIELTLFGAAALGLATAGHPVLAIVLAIAAAATSVLNASGKGSD